MMVRSVEQEHLKVMAGPIAVTSRDSRAPGSLSEVRVQLLPRRDWVLGPRDS